MLSTTTITGHLTQAPALRQTPTVKTVTTLRVAVDDHRHLADSPRYVDVDQWEDAATAAVEHPVRGQQITAEGILDARANTDQGGQLQAGWILKAARTDWDARPKTTPAA